LPKSPAQSAEKAGLPGPIEAWWCGTRVELAGRGFCNISHFGDLTCENDPHVEYPRPRATVASIQPFNILKGISAVCSNHFLRAVRRNKRLSLQLSSGSVHRPDTQSWLLVPKRRRRDIRSSQAKRAGLREGNRTGNYVALPVREFQAGKISHPRNPRRGVTLSAVVTPPLCPADVRARAKRASRRFRL
jgi:hypothetical protein